MWGDYNIARMAGARQSLANAAQNRRAGRQSITDALARLREKLMWKAERGTAKEEAELERELRRELQEMAGQQALRQTRLTGRQGMRKTRLTEAGLGERQQTDIAAAMERLREQQRFREETEMPHEMQLEKLYQGRGGEDWGSAIEQFNVAYLTLKDTYEEYYDEDGRWKPPEEKYEELRAAFEDIMDISNIPSGMREIMLNLFDRRWTARIAGGDTSEFDTMEIIGGPIYQNRAAGEITEGLKKIPDVLLPGLSEKKPIGQAVRKVVEGGWGELAKGAQEEYQEAWETVPGQIGDFLGIKPEGAPPGSPPVIQTISDNLKKIKQIMKDTPGPNWGDQTTVNRLLTDLEDKKIDVKNFAEKYQRLKDKWLTR